MELGAKGWLARRGALLVSLEAGALLKADAVAPHRAGRSPDWIKVKRSQPELERSRSRSLAERIGPRPLESGVSELRAVNNPDQDTLIRAFEDARRVLGEYIVPGPRDPRRTVERLLAILDRNDVLLALDRMQRRRVLRLIEIEQNQESQ
jgi:hypothetical protein